MRGSSGRQPIRALILDMDGLLVDSEPLSAVALQRFLTLHDRPVLPGTLERTLGHRLPEAVAIVVEAYGLPGPLADRVAEFDRLRLEALRGNVRPMPGARDLLDWAAARRVPAALATSSRRAHADLSVTEAGLAGRFTVEVCGDDVARGKPEPDIFLEAARRLGVPPAGCVVLEDAPAGLAAAVAAGMRRLWVPNAQTSHLAPGVAVDARLADLHEARRWLEDQLHGRAEQDTV